MEGIIKNSDYRQWLGELKMRIRQSQIKAAIRVNTELLQLYWDLGCDIVVRQLDAVWGSGVIKQLSADLRSEFPDMHGFSETNLGYAKKFYLFYSQDNLIFPQLVEKLDDAKLTQVGVQCAEQQEIIISQQVAGKLETHPIFQIPWGHHMVIITKCNSVKEALFYVRKTLENGWSRAMLMNFMETGLYKSQGKALNNFSRCLPAVQSDLAAEILKNPHNLDFLALTEGYKERELENALTANIIKFFVGTGARIFICGQASFAQGGHERPVY